MLDLEGLKAVGISTVGQRLAILKAVYLVKLAQNIPIDPEHYIPPCEPSLSFFCTSGSYPGIAEAQERQEHLSLDKLHDIVTDQGKCSLCTDRNLIDWIRFREAIELSGRGEQTLEGKSAIIL